MKARSGNTGKPATTVNVVYFGLVRSAVPQSEESISVPVGSTVRGLMELLCQRHGERLRDALFTAERTLGSSVMLVLDGANVLYRQGLDTPIGDNASIHVLLTTTAMAGG